jgi:hypothetical protein
MSVLMNDRAGDADRQASEAARQGSTVPGLDQEVQVVVQHGMVHEPEAKAVAAGGERRPKGGVLRPAA